YIESTSIGVHDIHVLANDLGARGSLHQCIPFWSSPESPGGIQWQINGYQEMRDSSFRRAIHVTLE
ncbi:Uncharacterized protein FKW44_022022, partial [Caligus rogercresseyi]